MLVVQGSNFVLVEGFLSISQILIFLLQVFIKEIRQSDKVFRDKAFKIASDPKYDSYQRDSASMVYKFFDKRSSGKGIAKETKLSLANELHKPIIKKFKKIKIHSSFKHHISGLDFADMQSLSK